MTPRPSLLAVTALLGLAAGCVDFQGQLDDCRAGAGLCAHDAGCVAPLVDCAGSCVDPALDNGNCGQCNHPCPSSQACFEGVCAGSTCQGVTCPTGMVCINAGCTQLNCVAVHCAPGTTCLNGACAPRDCDGGTCAEHQACVAGACVDVGCPATVCADGGICPAVLCPDGGSCLGGRCDGVLPCADHLKDPGETGVDCGGSCPGCGGGQQCLSGSDCASMSCVDGGVCSPSCVQDARCEGNPGGPCRLGTSDCGADGGSADGGACLDGPAAPDGLPCGSNLVCAAGQCTACTPGAACTGNHDACRAGILDCSGKPLCTNGDRLDAGVSCGAGQVCAPGGACVACAEGAPCTANPSSPCKQGQVSCVGGASSCVDGPPADAGVSCGVDRVCAAGTCVTCATGQVCFSNPGAPCTRGVTACGGTPGCLDGAPVPAGTTCGTGLVCSGAGACVACVTGQSCTTNPGAPCKTGSLDCTSGVPVCRDLSSSAPGIGCGTNLVCDGAGACVACTAGTVCTTNPSTCRLGFISCASGASQCIDGAPKGSGVSCGAGQVCDGNGFCGACSPGNACTGNPTACKQGVTSCASGSTQCIDGANTPAGTTCGVQQVCSGAGQCVSCQAGLSCTTNPNPCFTGLTSCTTGAQVCIDQSARPAGTSCGVNQVCSAAGVCSACTAGVSCATNPNPCKTGITSCATGASQCVDYQDKAPGTACGANQVCNAGACVSCTAGAGCTGNPNVCANGVTSCASGSSTCTDGTAKAPGTACGPNHVCNVSAQCTACTAGTACSTNPGECFTGKTSCSTGVLTCVNDVPKPAGATCSAGGVCDGSGGCAAPCALPWGGSITSGQTVTAYSATAAACGTTCAALSQPRTCTNGVLSGTFLNQSCTTPSTCPCALPWGGQLASGLAVTAYQSPSVACGNTCNGELRACTNGVLSGTFLNQSCANPTGCPCTLPWGGTLPSGQSVTAYSTAAPACGSTCAGDSQTRTCSNGVLSGTFTNQTCANPTGCACALPWGGTLPSGQSVTAYSTAAPACGSTCAGVSQLRTCTNGTLSGTFSNQTCAGPAGCACALPWGGTLPDTQSVTAYSSTTAACGSTCAAISQTRTCSNGTLSGTFSNQTCAGPTGCACALPWGGTLPDTQSVTAYLAASVACGSACVSESRACTNSALSGSFTSQTCAVAGGSKALGAACALGCECSSGLCGDFFVDGDGDTHGGSTPAKVCASAPTTAPAGFSTSSDDCCDTDPLAFPGETTFYGTADACGSFDYDCSGAATQQFPAAFTGCTYTSTCSDNGQGYPCDATGFAPGWGVVGAAPNAYTPAGAAVPACGASGLLVSSCSSTPAVSLCLLQNFCNFSAATSTQPCK